MQRRSKRLQEKAAGRSEDEEKTNRRMSAAGVMGLNAPANSKDLEHAQAMSAAEAAAARLDSYRKTRQVDDDEAKEERNTANARVRALAALAKSSEDKELRRESVAMQQNLERMFAGEATPSEAGAAAAASASKKKKKKRKKKGNRVRWYGIAKGIEAGVKFSDFDGIKHLVLGV